jgi:RNA polymerase sigma-70 factor (ECF subfamily)
VSAADAVVTKLFEEHYDRLQRYLVRFTGDGDAAADLAQEAFVRMLEHTPEAKHAVPWLFRVATNLARDDARKRIRRHELGLPERVMRAHSDPPPGPEQTIDREGARRLLDEAFNALNERERMALLMREEGYSYKEIADAVDTSVGSLGTMIARALRKAASRLREMEMQP